jgi:hypothetical protein
MDQELQNAPEKSAVDKFQLIPEFLKVTITHFQHCCLHHDDFRDNNDTNE